MVKEQYPIYIQDNLGRTTYTKWSEYERSIKLYWHNNTNIKILYKYYMDDIEIIAYNLQRQEIIKYDGNNFSVSFDLFKIRNSNLSFKVNKDILNNWRKQLK